MANQPSAQVGYQPNEAQLSRVAATRRFTRLYVYLPLGVFTTLLVAVIIYLLYLAVFPPAEETHRFLSGLADFILILWLVPMVSIFGLMLIVGIGGFVYYQYGLDEEARPLPSASPYGRVRTLLWRVDSLFIRIQRKLLEVENRIAQPVIRFNAWLAYIEAWIKAIKK